MARVKRTAGRTIRAAVCIASAASLLSGCGLVGKTKVFRDAPQTMTVTSPVFAGGTVPKEFTCHGAGQSPPVYWSGSPASTKSFALVVDDSAAPITPYVYWIVFNITPGTDLQSGMIPPGAEQAKNSAGVAKYRPPCPDGNHQYRFTVYALNGSLKLPSGVSLHTAWTAIAAHAIARGRLTATARSGPPARPAG